MGLRLGVVAIFAVLAATGCATRGSVKQLQSDLTRLQADLADLRLSQEATARETARAAADVKALDARMLELRASLRESSEEIRRLLARLEAAAEEIGRARGVATAPIPETAPTPVVAPERPSEAEPRADAAVQIYDAALANFRAREHGQAVLDFLDFIARYPRHPLAANAQYWIGEAYYIQRDYRQAITEFRKVLDMAPATPKAADALLKVGLCYSSLRDVTRAKQTWQRVAKEYPTSEAAARAKALLRDQASARR
jgi:tol-pal system protein YbgF